MIISQLARLLALQAPPPFVIDTFTALRTVRQGQLELHKALTSHCRCKPSKWRGRGNTFRGLATQAAATSHEVQAAALLPRELQQLVTTFSSVPDPKLKYQQLLLFAKKLPPLDKRFQTDENKVRGCVSQVWMVPELKDDQLVYWKADSDSQLTKGLAALLVQGLSGCRPEEILDIPANFISGLGLSQSLTPSRNNGFLNMFRLMQLRSKDLVDQARARSSRAAADPAPNSRWESKATETSMRDGSPVEQLRQQSEEKAAPSSSSSGDSAEAVAGDQPAQGGGRPNAGCRLSSDPQDAQSLPPVSRTPLRDSMQRKLEEALQPVRLQIDDESVKHAHHAAMKAGSASGSGETHFKITIASAAFEGMSSLKRHRRVYALLQEELSSGVHALSLVTQTPSEAHQ
ncbi:hypothetical protein WJX74_009422 [Apatococcus lobatus]|uniref:Fe-S metabolism associated domain-containing protein n=1 Tax=Apatococcus lobatus TaxID=904363 RepID=A0AAW1QMF1_9CHLO